MRWPVVACAVLLAACGGGGGGGAGAVAECDFTPAAAPQALTADEVERLLAQAAEAALQLGAPATIAVSDRVGNVLGVYRMVGAAATVTIDGGRGQSEGLDGLSGVVGADLAAIAKAITGAYLSSSGNAFSTRTAGFIVQDHFPPGVRNQPGGPLFGVQFSQLPCGDFVRRGEAVSVGPKRSPLGLSADPGGFPVYKNGQVVGGLGVLADGVYGLPTSEGSNLDERIAASALKGFEAPACIRAGRISLGGVSPPYDGAENQKLAVAASRLSDARVGQGALLAVAGYTPGGVRAGVAFGQAASGFVSSERAGGVFAAQGGQVLVDDNGIERHAPAGADGLDEIEVTRVLREALLLSRQTRALIRRPLGASAEVSIAVVDAKGRVLGLARTADAPVFGADVSVQKARTAAFFSSPQAAAVVSALPDAEYVGVAKRASSLRDYLEGSGGAQAFFGDPMIFTGGQAFSARAIGNLARPNFPDGIESASRGPLSKAASSWSVFNTGFQSDLIYNALVAALGNPSLPDDSCMAGSSAALKNGAQIFAGGVPLYRGDTLVGAVGVSGDGVDQDDLIGFLAVDEASRALGSGLGHAPVAMRADTRVVGGVRLRYVQCPVAPFLGGSTQNVCEGK